MTEMNPWLVKTPCFNVAAAAPVAFWMVSVLSTRYNRYPHIPGRLLPSPGGPWWRLSVNTA